MGGKSLNLCEATESFGGRLEVVRTSSFALWDDSRPRRAEGKLYQLPHVLLFSVFAMVSGANSYRGIRTYLKVHRQRLNKAFAIKWKRPPAHTAIRYILQGLRPADVEKVFRDHAANLNLAPASAQTRVIAFDGKTLKGSFDNFNDAKARQLLSAFAVDTALVLAHIEIDEKSNEIPAAQKLMEELHLAGHIVTCDAMHCQKNFRSRRRRQRTSDRPAQGEPADPLAEGRGRLRHGQAPVERADRGPETAQPPRNPSHRGVHRRARRRRNGMGAPCRRHHQGRARDQRPAARHRPLEALVRNLLLSLRPSCDRKPRRARHPQALGN